MNNKILATVAFGFVVVLAGCSGTAPEGSDIQSSQLKAPGKGSEKGDPGKDVPGDPGKDGTTSKDPSGKDVPPAPDGKGDPSDIPSKEPPTDPAKDPGKEPSDPGSAKCFGTVIKASCQSDDAWKDAAAKVCDSKGASLTALSTADDCKGGSTYAKIECCF